MKAKSPRSWISARSSPSLPGKDGLVHVSQISNERVEKVSDKLKEGDAVRVKVLEVDKQGRIRLSIKAVLEDEQAAAAGSA